MPQSIRSTTRSAVFAPLSGAGRADLVAQRLSDAIALGVLADGERLPSETDLARQFGVAVVTAREALEALRGRGLVTTRRGREGGSFVTFSPARTRDAVAERLAGLSRIELRDLAVHYAAIAGMAAELAADRASDDDIDSLRTIAAAADSTSEGGARRATSRFLLEIAALSQSARLVREELRLQGEFGPLLWLCLRDQSERDRGTVLMAAVIDAVARVDGALARQLVTARVSDAVEWLIDAKAELETKESR